MYRLMTRASVLAAALVIAGASPASAQQVRWANVAAIDDYSWIDHAEAMSETIGEAPPDLAFDFGGQEIWAWTLGDGSVLIVERQFDGPHGYYFDAGSDAPFLVRHAGSHGSSPGQPDEARSNEMSIGYQQGMIAVVYTADGDVVPRESAENYVSGAMSDWMRGQTLYRAMRDRTYWTDVSAPLWLDFSDTWFDWGDDWGSGIRLHPEWRRWHNGAASVERRHRYDDERKRREDVASRFHQWDSNGFHGTPPGRYKPPPAGWTPRADSRSRNAGNGGAPRQPPLTGGPARVQFPGPVGTSQPQPPHPAFVRPAPPPPHHPPPPPPPHDGKSATDPK